MPQLPLDRQTATAAAEGGGGGGAVPWASSDAIHQRGPHLLPIRQQRLCQPFTLHPPYTQPSSPPPTHTGPHLPRLSPPAVCKCTSTIFGVSKIAIFNSNIKRQRRFKNSKHFH